MHDYFVDRLVHVGSLGGLTRSVEAKAATGGGGLHGIRQSEIRGGNAVNLAHALGRLGLRTLLVTHTETAHEGLLRKSFEGLDVELRLKPLKAGMTVAFEASCFASADEVALTREGTSPTKMTRPPAA